MKTPNFLTEKPGAVMLSIKVQPRASRNEISGISGQELKIRVTAPPVDAAANDALIGFLAAALGCPRRNLQLLRGHTSRHKVVQVLGMSAASIVAALDPPDRGGGI